MDVATFCRQSRVLIVAGKGGVGKTTITAALAKMASSSGLNVLVVELEGKSGVPAAFGREHSLDYDEAVLDSLSADGAVRARRITPDDALVEYLADHGMKRISKRLASSGALDVVATAIPGIRDILVLGKVKQLERDDPSDLILVDAPATGHAMTFLSSAKGLLGAARSGPVRAQAADVVELLSDAKRCQVVLVTLPEEMPVNEAVETAYQLEDRIGITLGPPKRPSKRASKSTTSWLLPWDELQRSVRTATGSRPRSGSAWPTSCPSPSCTPGSSSAHRSVPRSSSASKPIWPRRLDGSKRGTARSSARERTEGRRTNGHSNALIAAHIGLFAP